MQQKESLTQINAAIENLQTATTPSALIQAQAQALSFIQAAFDLDEIPQTQKQALEKKVRRIYRNQLIEESA